MPAPLTALIVDDAALYRKTVSLAVAEAGATVAGVAADGAIALARLADHPVEVVFLDVYMPGQDGLAVLREIRRRWPTIAVVMMSGLAQRDHDVVVEALSAGAVDFVAKPGGNSLAENVATLSREVARTLGVVAARKGSMRAEPAPPPVVPSAATAVPSLARPRMLLIGASTGGPEALARIVPLFPATFPAPIALVQHIPAGFTRSLATTLGRGAHLTVKEADDGETLRAGTIALAPGGKHMTFVRRGTSYHCRLTDDPPVHHCRPAVDPMFLSAAQVFGEGEVAAVVLTGMGTDGAVGARAIKERHGVCLVQDEGSCVVYGMPRAVAEAGLADAVLPLEKIPAALVTLFGADS